MPVNMWKSIVGASELTRLPEVLALRAISNPSNVVGVFP